MHCTAKNEKINFVFLMEKGKEAKVLFFHFYTANKLEKNNNYVEISLNQQVLTSFRNVFNVFTETEKSKCSIILPRSVGASAVECTQI